MLIRWSSLIMGLLVLSLAAPPLPAEEVGKFMRVVNQVDQLKQGKEPAQTAKVPDSVANQDQVRTKDQSLAVVHFLDDSTMTISPKSKVTIEDYMYDASKGQAKGSIKIMEGVVETIIPATEKLQQKDIQIRTTTAIAGIRGTKLITVAKPEGTVFYVIPEDQAKPAKSKIRIRMYSPDTQPDAPAIQFVTERLKQKMELRRIVEEGLEAGYDPCALVKAAFLLGVDLQKLVRDFQQVCSSDPEFETLCTPCIILKCATEAARSLREVDVAEGQYGILMKNLAPILGDLKPGDLAIISNLLTTGIDGVIPNYPPTAEQINEAKLPQEANAIAEALIKAGADPADVNRCLQGMGATGIPGGEALAYSPVVVGELQPLGQIGTGQTTPEHPASQFQ